MEARGVQTVVAGITNSYEPPVLWEIKYSKLLSHLSSPWSKMFLSAHFTTSLAYSYLQPSHCGTTDADIRNVLLSPSPFADSLWLSEF